MAIPLLARKPNRILPPLLRSDDLLRGLAFALFCNEPGKGPLWDAVRGYAVPAGSASAKVMSPYGLAAHINGSGNSSWRSSGNLMPLATSTGDGGGDLTLLMMMNCPATAGGGQSLGGQGDYSGAGGGVGFFANWNASFANSSGTIGFDCFTASSDVGITCASQLDGNYHVLVGKRTGSSHALWIDATKPTQTSFGSGISNILGGTNNTIGINDDGAQAFSVPFMAGWNRALSDAEIVYVSLLAWEALVDYGHPALSPLPLPPGIWRIATRLPPRRSFVWSDARLRR
ncbi:MAG TPA: hypothetical protein VMU85_08585 [Stellaceae bacterium]|nr:hypothetical protein [Stellaceae bacterium]